ncbi:MAG: hypothetical protein U0736_17690 [Gemmataceae bacterium]
MVRTAESVARPTGDSVTTARASTTCPVDVPTLLAHAWTVFSHPCNTWCPACSSCRCQVSAFAADATGRTGVIGGSSG